jgi:hypothetical protein
MRYSNIFTILLVFIFSGLAFGQYTGPRSIALSQDLLQALKLGHDYADFKQELETYSWDQLQTELSSDTEKNTFWINFYNASVQLKLKQMGGDPFKKRPFFSQTRHKHESRKI